VGKEGHKIPSAGSSLSVGGVFDGVGKAMAHSLIHTGVAGFGISKAIARYLLTETLNMRTDLKVALDDIVCPDLRACLESVSS